MIETITIEISDTAHIGEARRSVSNLAARQGFDETDRGRAALVATELATNITRHAGEGQILLRSLTESENSASPTLEILALDKGPGIANVGLAMQDGYSTMGTKGEGLGAVRRQSDFFDVYSAPGLGTTLVARIAARIPREAKPENAPAPSRETIAVEIGCVCVAVRGETICGDAWAVKQEAGSVSVLVADGLGHGPNAAEASRCAVDTFMQSANRAPVPALEAIHGALRNTRGAACTVAQVEPSRNEMRYVGVGNIAGRLLHGDTARHMVSRNGTVGHNLPRLQETRETWPVGATLVMHSDGLLTQWNLEKYTGLVHRHAGLIAAILYRDFQRGRDDVTVLVVRLA